MSSAQRLLDNLYGGLSRDPQPQAAIQIAFAPLVYPDGVARTPSSYWIQIQDDRLYGVNQLPQVLNGVVGAVDPLGFSGPHANLDLDLSSQTLAQLCATLSAYPGIIATLLPGVDPTTAAHALCEGAQDVVAQSQLTVLSSTLWSLIKPWAAELSRAVADTQLGFTEVLPSQAQGFWLSSLGDLYGVDRLASESDTAYAQRILYHVLSPRANNQAMADYLRYAFGLQTVSVVDDSAALHTGIGLDQYAPFRFFVEVDPGPSGGLPVAVADLTTVVEQIKAWGTIWQLLLKLALTEEVGIVSDTSEGNLSLALAPTAEALGLAPFDQLAALVVQEYSDSARPEMFPFTFEVWKNPADEVISACEDMAVVLWGAGGGWRSWVESIQDIWNWPPIINLEPYGDAASLVAQAAEGLALTFAVAELVGIAAAATTQVSTQLTQALIDVTPKRAKPFSFEQRTSMFADANALIGPPQPTPVDGAHWTPQQGWAAGVGDPSWWFAR